MQATAILLGAWLAAVGAGQGPAAFRADFDGPDALASFGGSGGQVVPGDRGSPCLLVERSDAADSTMRQIRLPAELTGPGLVTISASVKAEDVSKPPNPWNGVKVMLIVETEGGGRDHPQLPLPQGTFGWSTVRHTLRLPPGVTRVTLSLGLEQVSGKAWFDEVEIRAGRILPDEYRVGTMFKGHDVPRLRGVMHGPEFDAQNIRDLAGWGANQVRWQLNWVPMKRAEEWAADLAAYDRWLDGALAQTDLALDACQENGIDVLLDLHCPPGGRAEGGLCRMFTEKRYQEKFLDVWRKIATRYRGQKVIYAYDLVNEPVEPGVRPQGLLDWRELATEAARIIRRIDPQKPIVVEPGPWGGCGGFDSLVPLDLDRVIYSFHMYQPHAFTHQFQFTDQYPDGLSYPGTIQGTRWDKEQLRIAIQPAIDFQRQFNVQIYVGEFSAIRWAPDNSAYRYLKDLVDLFEEYGWDWSYHAYREWPGWSVEHTSNRDDSNPSPTPTDREKLLRSWFSQNRRPWQP
jgi:hypothetical protein